MKNFLKWIGSFFKSSLQKFIESAFPAGKQIVIDLLKDVALQTVIELQSTDMSNADKRKAAFDRIKVYALGRGIEAKDHVIDLAISTAVSVMKGV